MAFFGCLHLVKTIIRSSTTTTTTSTTTKIPRNIAITEPSSSTLIVRRSSSSSLSLLSQQRRQRRSFSISWRRIFVLSTTTAAVLSCTNTLPFVRCMSTTMTHTTERDGKGTIIVSPKNEASQSGLIVICHGLGDSAEGFVDVAEQLSRAMPYVKFILPTAPTQPVTMNMGMPMPSWYDIVGLDERSNENCKGIVESRAKIQQILENEHSTTGLPYSRMVLAGFSQGGALSLYTGLQLDQPLAGIVVMSGYLAAAGTCQPKQFSVPIYHGHGTMDPMVQYSMAEKTKMKLTSLGVKDYTLESFPIQHTVSPQELQKVMMFLMKVLPPDDTCKITLKDPKEMSVKELKAAIRKAGLTSKAVGLMEKSEFIKLLEDYRAGK